MLWTLPCGPGDILHWMLYLGRGCDWLRQQAGCLAGQKRLWVITQGPAPGWGVARSMMVGVLFPESRPPQWETGVRGQEESFLLCPEELERGSWDILIQWNLGKIGSSHLRSQWNDDRSSPNQICGAVYRIDLLSSPHLRRTASLVIQASGLPSTLLNSAPAACILRACSWLRGLPSSGIFGKCSLPNCISSQASSNVTVRLPSGNQLCVIALWRNCIFLLWTPIINRYNLSLPLWNSNLTECSFFIYEIWQLDHSFSVCKLYSLY